MENTSIRVAIFFAFLVQQKSQFVFSYHRTGFITQIREYCSKYDGRLPAHNKTLQSVHNCLEQESVENKARFVRTESSNQQEKRVVTTSLETQEVHCVRQNAFYPLHGDQYRDS